MKVKLMQDEVIGWGPQRIFAGQEVDLPEDIARTLVAQNVAVPCASDLTVLAEEVLWEDDLDLEEIDERLLEEELEEFDDG